ncbi:hypothetical protein MCU_01459 [Bartonella elizabethae Re6043vi]|uniref:Uncharacterized protein n=2 Tax=Bartonella elizabethae TaxID=807 RepID=A0ABN0GIN3_BAREL|nr:hypothetical protein MCU_01459 [Bartonella elizabethae Re6043vi]
MDGFKSWREIFEKGRHCWIVEWRVFLFFSKGGMEEKGIGRRESREEGQGLEAWLAEPLDRGARGGFYSFSSFGGGMGEKMFVYRGLRFARWSR